MLPYHDAWTAEKCKNSSGFFSACSPRNAGITIVGNATAKPRSSSKRFLAELANIWRFSTNNVFGFSIFLSQFLLSYLWQNGSECADFLNDFR